MNMKKFAVLSGIILVFIFAGCKKENSGQTSTLIFGDTTEISMSEKLYNYENNISIKLDSILNDSRCPASVDCIWAGNAEVKYIFTQNDIENTIILNTLGGSNFKSDTIITGYTIELINLYPYPEEPGEIGQGNYYSDVLVLKN
ncbi:hypothetical protein ACFLRR_00075 [Bacteroidota bacterium]